MGLGRARSYITPSVSENGLEFPPAVDFFLPDPVREGFQSFANAAICDIVGAQEAFFRAAGAGALAHRASVSRARAGCYAGSNPPLVPEYEPPPFVGGQCNIFYRMHSLAALSQGGFHEFTTQNGSAPLLAGPIRSFRYYVGGGQWRFEAVHNDPEQVTDTSIGVPASLYTSIELVQIVPVGGVPDDCGNVNDPAPVIYPPGQELPPAPSPGQEVYPPGITTIDFDFNGTFSPVGFFHGSANIDVNGNVNLNFGGIDVNISPDLGFDFGDDGTSGEGFGSDPPEFPDIPEPVDYSGDFEGLGDALDSIGNKQDVLGDSLDSVGLGVGSAIDRIAEVKALLDIDFDDSLTWLSCRGEEALTPYAGNGLRGLEAIVRALAVSSNQGVSEYCELLPPSPLEGDVVLTEFIESVEIDNFFDRDVDSQTKAVSLDVELARNPYSVRRGSSGENDDLQGRFAVVCFLEEVSAGSWQGISEPINQYYSVGLYRVPKTDNPVRVRVSVSAGSSCTYRELI